MKRALTALSTISLLTIVLISGTPRASHILLETLETLASNTFEGRQAGSDGGKMAVDYLTRKMKDMGVAALGRGHEQGFTIFTKMVKVGKNFFETSNNRSMYFEPLSMSATGEIKETGMIFVGYGISIPKSDTKLIYDDYMNIDVKDKIVIIMTGDPAVGNPDSKFRDPAYISYRTLFYKVRNAAAHGAAGVLIVQDPLSLNRAEENPFFDDREGGGERMDVLAGQAKISYVNTLLADQNLKEIQIKMSKSQRPMSFDLAVRGNFEVHLEKETGRVSNIVGYIEGTDPILKKEMIVIGAHMDHLGFGGPSSMDDRRSREIHNGADDNASGTALVMDMVKVLKTKKFKRSIAIVLFNAEEIGLLGSSHFVSSWPRYESTYGKMIVMLNFDMVGRFKKKVQVMGAGSSFEWMDYLNEVAKNTENIFEFQKTSVGSSDHASFAKAQVPILFFTTGAHDDYHRASDDSNKIDYSSITKIRDFSIELIEYLDENDKKLTFDPSFSTNTGNGRSRGYGAHLGCVPQFGQSDDIVGVLCTGTSPDSPAEAAGMKANDILTRIGEIEIKSIYDLAFALKYYRAGDKVILMWKRGRDQFSKKITLTRKNKNKETHRGHHYPFTHEL